MPNQAPARRRFQPGPRDCTDQTDFQTRRSDFEESPGPMPTTFSRTLRSLEADDPRRRSIALLVGTLAISWAAWFLLARVPVYEVAETARLEVKAAAHPIATQVDGRVLTTNLAIGREVVAGEVLVILDSEQERLAIHERRAHRD
jgi:multidrug efflux pump subunit AcrA (membrane-fusion protein)